jgi:hypothetical protein
MDNGFPEALHVDLDDIRHLEIRYSRARPDKIELAVEYVGGRKEMSLMYIHLRDTQIMLSNGAFFCLSGPWRGKRSAVDGFWLGEVIS